MSKRGAAAAVVLLLWAAGLGVLVRTEYFRPHLERLAESALRVNPGAVYFGVVRNDRQIGFASSIIDTARTEISVIDYVVTDTSTSGPTRRAAMRTKILLSRGFRVRAFDVARDDESAPPAASGSPPPHAYSATGTASDSQIVVEVRRGLAAPDTQRIRLANGGGVLLPSLVPFAIALEQPHVGKRYAYPVFDPMTLAVRTVSLAVQAESLFVLNDSASFDPAAGRWRGTFPDTVRGWRIASTDTGGFSGWIDAQGQAVRAPNTSGGGGELRRLPYEEAFGMWRIESERRSAGRPVDDRSVQETTAIAARQPPRDSMLSTLVVRLRNAEPNDFDVARDFQRLNGDTVTIERAGREAMAPGYSLAPGSRTAAPDDLRPSVGIQSDAPEIVTLSRRIRGPGSDPRVVAERIARWVHDSISAAPTPGAPSALDVLRSRRGDAGEHARLFVALARAARIPAREVSGLLLVNGRFYYHRWVEILLTRWVPIDPTFAQFPADAAHLRFVGRGAAREPELLRLLGTLTIDILTAR